jgi:serine/threonine protein kinase
MDISSGMKYFYVNDVIYLDIKPENILFNKGHWVKIYDFRYSV